MSVTIENVKDVLRRHIAEVLYCGPEEVEEDVDFSDLGLDSVLSAELTSAINSEYGLQTDIEVIHQNPKLSLLAQYVVDQAAVTAA
ncbi:acyl carrier protein [Streptomyces sp. ISID311]|uniref:acyl carrier protein n=1 Tax=Streptomyces sp. ISID311 TaxID=2601673 RepID=UPI00164BBF44|nr:acyl carrier protein [Streptomyces sp. ISID311]